MILDSALLNHPLSKTLPHLIDFLLLSSAALLTVTIQQYPIVNSWLTAKLIALIAYILLGTIALKRGKTFRIRLLALAGSLFFITYIIGVALTKSPISWLSFID